MEYRQWYERDIKTSLLGFGCMRFTTNEGIVDEEKAIRLLQYAYEHGVNYFDTARVYLNGQSEPTLGKALKNYRRESFYIATKFSQWNFKSLDEVEDLIDKQLADLQTDYIDFYLLHAMNKDRLNKAKEFDLLSLIKKWKEQGKIRNIGFSFHDQYQTFKSLLDMYPWDFCQIQFNYMDKDIQQGMQGYNDLLERKIPIIVMEPLKGGRLSKFNEAVESKLKLKSKDSLTKWAFRWVASQKGVMTALSGMNELSQLEENIEIFNNFSPMTADELELIEYVGEELRKLEVIGCTKCQYCMPCPAGVNIPANFEIVNEHQMYKNDGHAKWVYGMLKQSKADATACVYCKKCVPKCPQNINIPERMIDVMELMNTMK